MSRYIIRRVARIIPLILLLSIFVFSMMHFLPGDPATLMLREATATSQEAVEKLREQLGLNDPLYVQYWRFISRAARGDFGRSIQTNRPVMGEILEVFPQTLQLAFAAMVVAAIVGLFFGTVAALKQNTIVDNASMVFALAGVSMPIFWVGLLLMLVFSVRLGWIPVTGQGGIKRLILPAIALGWGSAGVIARLTRASLLEVMRQDYVTVARAKGLRERVVVRRHALRNALIPVTIIVGLQFGALLGGAVITETVFARQGIGRLAVNAILVKDFPLVQGTVFVAALAYMLVNLFVDIGTAWLDPRIQIGAETGK
jgi:peptide/nickel transport system permease protein